VGIPVKLTAGQALRRNAYDQNSPNHTWTLVGPDGIAANTDNRVGFYDSQNLNYSRINQSFGTPKTQ